MSAQVTCDFDKNGYRLPKEKEWEYAAKAGTKNRWAGTNDDKDLEAYACFEKNSTNETHPVKSKLPNEWGFYDMTGNVREWCWDKYDPKKLEPSADRVYRGGGWDSNAVFLRSGNRLSNSPNNQKNILGFRVCRSLIN